MATVRSLVPPLGSQRALGHHSPGQARGASLLPSLSGVWGCHAPSPPLCHTTHYGSVWGGHSPQWAFPGLGVQRPLFVEWTPERRGGWVVPWEGSSRCSVRGVWGSRIYYTLWSSGGVGAQAEPLFRAGSLGWGRGGSPGLLSGCWQPESPSPARPATGQEGQSSHVRHPAQPFLRRLSAGAARRSRQAHCITLAQPSIPGRQSCSLSPECPSCGAAKNPQVWGRRGECRALWVLTLCHVGSGFSVYLG